jgi:hypothetical protein
MSLLILLLVLMLHCSAYCLEFSATATFKYSPALKESMMGVQPIAVAPMKIYCTDDKETHIQGSEKLNSPLEPKTPGVYVIYRYDRSVVWEIIRDRIDNSFKKIPPYYTEKKIDGKDRSSEFRISQKRLKNDLKRVGTEYVAGKKCNKYQNVVTGFGINIKETYWIYDEKVIMKFHHSQFKDDMWYSFELNNYQEGQQSPSLFEIPSGIQKQAK